MSSPSRLIAMVTGAARGIGAEIAMRLADDGCDVVVLDLDTERCRDTVERIQGIGRQAIARGVDVADEASVASAIASIVADFGVPSILVNNAGVLRERMLQKTSLEEWNLMIDVNLRGAFLMSKALYPHLRRAQFGRIINLSSTGALGDVGLTAYSAAKAGLIGLTRTLALELGRHGTTVNAVAPGFVATDMTQAVADRCGIPFDDMQKTMAERVAVGRVGLPQDIAHAVSFFADRRSGFVNGQVLYVAGGPHG